MPRIQTPQNLIFSPDKYKDDILLLLSYECPKPKLNKSKIQLLELVCGHHEIIDTESHCPRRRERKGKGKARAAGRRDKRQGARRNIRKRVKYRITREQLDTLEFGLVVSLREQNTPVIPRRNPPRHERAENSEQQIGFC
jgi:hypothetical protein